RDEQEDEEDREHALHRLARAGAQRKECAQRPEAEPDQEREDEDDGDPPGAGREVHAEDEPRDDPNCGLNRGHRHHAAELAGQERDAAHGRQREPVEETSLDVPREIRAGVHGREERALHERNRECECQVRVGWEPGQVRGRLEAARVDREQEQREDEREDDVRGLARGAHDRPPRKLTDLLDEALAHAGSSASSGSSSSSPAPSRERPVLARKTSSSDGWWSWRFSTLRLSASRARTISARSASLVRRRTATPLTATQGSPKRARIAAARSFSSESVGTTSTVGRPTSAFSCAGVPSATIRPWSMIPTRLASTSASSRYWVVRKTVTPSSVARRRTSSQSALRLCTSRPVVGSSRKRICGEWTSASARSSRRFIQPE